MLEELLAERGIEVDHVTVFRWVQRFTPVLVDAARPCRHSVGDRWHGRRDLRRLSEPGQSDQFWTYMIGRGDTLRSHDQHGEPRLPDFSPPRSCR